VFYVDGHRKPVYSDALLPRGLVGRLGTVLGCRSLTLIHDAAGHPLLATTQRGDAHLTRSCRAALALAAAATPALARGWLIIDREAQAAPFLADLQAQGYPVVTLLRHNQYTGLASFSAVGPFQPLTTDRAGQVVREVAAAQFLLPHPDRPRRPGQQLCLRRRPRRLRPRPR